MSERDKRRGLYRKYIVLKLPDPDEQTAFTNRALNGVEQMIKERYGRSRIEPLREPSFVLTPTKDEMSRVALYAYAEEARSAGFELLADDLIELLEETEVESGS